jgi:hypothetical protein
MDDEWENDDDFQGNNSDTSDTRSRENTHHRALHLDDESKASSVVLSNHHSQEPRITNKRARPSEHKYPTDDAGLYSTKQYYSHAIAV